MSRLGSLQSTSVDRESLAFRRGFINLQPGGCATIGLIRALPPLGHDALQITLAGDTEQIPPAPGDAVEK